MNKYILDANGEPEICNDVLVWGRWFEANDAARRVAYDEFNGGKVSTVFLGLDHAFNLGAPMLFETMIFGGAHDGYQERYSTRVAAERGHQTACALAQSTGAVDPVEGIDTN